MVTMAAGYKMLSSSFCVGIRKNRYSKSTGEDHTRFKAMTERFHCRHRALRGSGTRKQELVSGRLLAKDFNFLSNMRFPCSRKRFPDKGESRNLVSGREKQSL